MRRYLYMTEVKAFFEVHLLLSELIIEVPHGVVLAALCAFFDIQRQRKEPARPTKDRNTVSAQ